MPVRLRLLELKEIRPSGESPPFSAPLFGFDPFEDDRAATRDQLNPVCSPPGNHRSGLSAVRRGASANVE